MIVSTPPRRHGSARRTTTHLGVRPEGLHGPVRITARGRDLGTDLSGAATVLDEAHIELVAEFGDGTILGLESTPHDRQLDGLLGVSAYSGFRQRAADAVPEDTAAHTLRSQLLDDLPIALLLSGRVLRAEGVELAERDRPPPTDRCAGFVADGVAMRGFQPGVGPPLGIGPKVRGADVGGLAWHHHEQPPSLSTFRRRRIDVWRQDGVDHVDSHFRDSYTDGDGIETAVHEYYLRATTDIDDGVVLSCEAVPGALPYPECPTAGAPSTQSIVGMPITDLRSAVSRKLTGVTSCTHLNDALRALDGVDALLAALDRDAHRSEDSEEHTSRTW